MRVSFVVEGEPVPKGRPRFNPYSKRAYTPQRTKSYEEQIAWKAAVAMRGKAPMKRPVHVDVRIFFGIPKSAKQADKEAARTEHLWHCRKCDADNIFKAIADGANGIVFADDKQICEMECSKRYSMKPRVEVEVYELEGAAR